jgi:hypothetical protein
MGVGVRISYNTENMVMKILLFVTGILIASTAIGTGAHAQSYPWCARYGNGFGASNCGFSTFQQCQADVSGIGGFCAPNTLYQPAPGPRHRHVQP